MADHSDSDSSPKSSSSSPSARRRSPPRARAHSDESGSSDGVLVELPSQEARSPGADRDGGVLVNMPADDATSGETFEDAPDDLATAGSLSARSLDESIAVIDFPDESSATAECRKYKEEREVFAREAVALRRMLRELVGQEASGSLQGEDPDERVPASPTQLHSMLDDCSRLVLELNSVVRAREHEIESLRARAAEAEVSREVVDAYLGSWREGSELAIGRIVASVNAVVGQDDVRFEGADQDGISAVERKTLLLAERYGQVLLGIEQLEHVLAEVKPGFVAMGQCDHATILGIASEELVSSKRNEADFQQKVSTFGEENKALAEELEKVKAARDAANTEASKSKAEFEQMEHKLLTTKEKLSMAVTKGKSLVQHRDSLKQALAEKTGELERCMAELQQKSDALQAAEGRVEEHKVLIDEKSNEHEKCLDELRETQSPYNRMVGRTRSGQGQSACSDEELPPSPTMAEVLLQIERNRSEDRRVLEVIARNTSTLADASGSGQGSGHQPRGGLAEFLRTQPPTFSRSEDPLDADDWLRLVERKLNVAQCQDHEKALFASHQLEGAALSWWESFLAMQPEGHVVSWEEFRTAFRRAHIPAGLMKLKKKEFLSLKQGRKSVTEYLYEFNHLARYAPAEVATDEAKQEKFMEGLSEELQDKLSIVDFPDFQTLVDKAIVAEHKGRALGETRKRKWEAQKSTRVNLPRPRFGQAQAPRPQASAPAPRPPQAVSRPRAPAAQQGDLRNPAAEVTCFSCGLKGHYANNCPKKTGAAPRPNGGRGQGSGHTSDQKVVPATQGVGSGRVNHISAEEVQEVPDVVLGSEEFVEPESDPLQQSSDLQQEEVDPQGINFCECCCGWDD